MKLFYCMLLCLFTLFSAEEVPEEDIRSPTPVGSPIQINYVNDEATSESFTWMPLPIQPLAHEIIAYDWHWYKDPRILAPIAAIGVVCGGIATAFIWYFKKL